MAFDIDSIIAHINKNFFAKPQYYQVKIFASGGAIQSTVPDASEDIMLNCSAIAIPGINIGYQPDKRLGVGTVINYPNGKGFTEINMTFYESEYENERKYFSQWIDTIYDKTTKRFEFYKNYVKNIEVTQFNRKSQVVYKAVMFECYPTSISALDRGYGLDGIATFTVGFQLSEMQEIFYQNGAPTNNDIIWNPPQNIPPTPKNDRIIWNTPASLSPPVQQRNTQADLANPIPGIPPIDVA